MKTRNIPRPNLFISRTKLLRIGIFIAFVALVTFPLFTVSSASFSQKTSRDKELDRTANTVWSAAASISRHSYEAVKSPNPAAFGLTPEPQVPFLTFLTQQGESLASYESTCATLTQAFVVGDTVCAKVTNISPLSRRIYWINPDGHVIQADNVSSTSPSATRQVNQAGNWKLYLIDSDGALRQAYSFTVSDPVQPQVDLSVIKYIANGGSTVVAGGNIDYRIIVQNNGPDTATGVQLTESVPNDTTYQSSQQDSGPTFTCTIANICTIASLAAGDSAVFSFVYQVNSGTPAGTVISNTADVTSATAESHSADNTWTASATVSGSGGGGGTCTLSCPADITTPADTTQNGQSGAIVHFDSPSAQGSSCGAITVNHCNDCFFPVGTTVVSATEDGTTGASCSFSVTVTEGAAPTITCPPDKTATADSNCEATVDPGSPTTTGDNVTVTSSRSDGLPLSDPYPAGTTTITWTATNSSGTASCQQAVTVNDTTAPTITCPANVTTGNDVGQCSATVNPGTATATDNCDSPTVMGTRSDGQALNAPYPKGTTTITWTATDGSGNSASCAQTVTVNDTENPTITCPAPTSASADANCQAPVPDVASGATASDNCSAPGSITKTQSPAAGTMVGSGTHTITVTATDEAGNSSTCTTTFTVNDTTAPTVQAPADSSASADANCQAPVPDYTANSTASDNCDSSLTLTQSPTAGTLVGLGPHTVTVTATDDAGNHSSDDVVFTVNDTTAPTVQAPADSSASADANCQAPVPNYVAGSTASDNCDNSVTLTQSPAAGTMVGKGPHTVTVTATDDAGNHSSDTVVFTVNDTTAPVISCPANITRSNDPGMCSANINPGTATATDNCDSPTVTGTRSDNQPLTAPYPVGTTTITWTATDGSGNHASCAQTITVNDTQPPVISCQADIIADFDPAVNGAVVTYAAPVGTDNCPGATTVQTAGLASGSTFPAGTTTNTFRVTDGAGLTATCSFKVTVALTSIIGLDSVTITGSGYADSYSSAGGYPATKGSLANVLSNGTITIGNSGKVWGNVRSTRANVNMTGSAQVTGNATAGTTVTTSGSASVGGTRTNNAPGAVMTLPAVPACGPPYSPNSGISGTYTYNASTGDLTVNGINIATLANGNYCFHNVTLGNSGQLKVNGLVVIKLTGTLNTSGATSLNNTTQIPSNLRILSSYSGSNGVVLGNGVSVYALIYAANTGLNLSGSAPLFGTFAGKTLIIGNSGAIHYDTQLKSIWPDVWTLILGP